MTHIVGLAGLGSPDGLERKAIIKSEVLDQRQDWSTSLKNSSMGRALKTS